jgi:hypothetical protein
MPERQDRCLIRNPIADQFDSCKAAHGEHLDQRIFHRRIIEAVPLLHQVNPEHCGQWIRRTATFAADFRINRLDKIKQGQSGHNLIHFGQEILLLDALFGGGLLVIGEAKLLAAHHLSTGLGLCPYSRADGLGFPESP